MSGLELWQANKIMSWHNLEGNSVQWFSIVCIDRKEDRADLVNALKNKLHDLADQIVDEMRMEWIECIQREV
ncbi:hypothetical protein ACS0TY_007203 [Phlomoides rotata]